MRSDLAKVEGVSEIVTDVRKRTCEFRLANKDLDLKKTLEELAQTNDHLKGFEVIAK